MPITTVFSSADYSNSAKDILREHLLDYFPASDHTITSEEPSTENLKKAIVYLAPFDGDNLDAIRTRRSGKSLQRKEISFGVTLITAPSVSNIPKGPANRAREMAAIFERNAILRDGYKLAEAGLKHATISPFVDVVLEGEQTIYRKYGILSVTVYVEAS